MFLVMILARYITQVFVISATNRFDLEVKCSARASITSNRFLLSPLQKDAIKEYFYGYNLTHFVAVKYT